MGNENGNKNTKCVLITGGAGCIGSVISGLALEKGYRVKVVDALWFKKIPSFFRSAGSGFEFIEGDIRNPAVIDKALKDIDIVIHTAGVVGEPAAKKFPELTYEVNYKASVELISKAAAHGVKGFLFFSTCSNYGISEGFANEETPLKPLSLYAQTKVDVERYLIDMVRDLDWVICRLSTVYGCSPRIRFDLTVNDFIMNAYMNKYLDIFLPYTYRPYIHVYDVARVVMGLIDKFEQVKRNVFNVGFNGENYRKIEVAECVKSILPETRIEIVKSGTDLRDYQVDFSKLRDLLNMENTFNVERGVKEVLALLESGAVTDPYDRRYYNTTPDLRGA